MTIVWKNVAKMAYIHLSGLYGIYLCLTGQIQLRTFSFQLVLGYLSLFGVSAGAHRLWSHRSYKATFPLRVLLMIFQTLASQDSIYIWARDHRVHHKFTDTNADPHNPKRGFMFSHIGWTLMRRHEDVKIKGKLIELDDLKADSVVMFQKEYFNWLAITISYAIPRFIPIWLWGEDPLASWNLVLMRNMLTLNSIFCINSFAHKYGDKPYDRNINPTDNKFVSLVAIGEGWHNYHHTFPWDYKVPEIPTYGYNWTRGFIDFFAWIGWAYELKTVPEKMIVQRSNRTGDGSYSKKQSASDMKDKDKADGQGLLPSWGWNDEDLSKDDKKLALVLNKKG